MTQLLDERRKRLKDKVKSESEHRQARKTAKDALKQTSETAADDDLGKLIQNVKRKSKPEPPGPEPRGKRQKL